MKDWFRDWYVPRAEYVRMKEYYSGEITVLRARIQELEDQLKIEAIYSLDDFSSVDVVHEALPTIPSNVITVDFRRAK